MYPFTRKVTTTKKSVWVNAIKWIVIHHTAGWNFDSNMDYLSINKVQSSVHFVIWSNEECGKIGDPKDILRHAGNWKRWDCKNTNKEFLWIEVVWYGQYNIQQLIRLTDLVEYLMYVYKIPNDMIIRHSDCTQQWYYTEHKILWDWIRKSKKMDIWIDFFPMWFDRRRKWLKPREKSRYWE